MLLLLACLSLNTFCSQFEVPQKNVMASYAAGAVSIVYNDTNFYVKNKNGLHKVQNAFVDQELRTMTAKKLKSFLNSGYITVDKFGASDYSLKAEHRIKGGGYWGATIGWYASGFAVRFVGHGAIQLAALASGPAYPVTLAALEGTFGPAIEATALVASVGGAIGGGAATGPM